MTDEDKDAYFVLKDKYDLFAWIIMSFTPYTRMLNKNDIPPLPLIDRIKRNKEVIQRIPDEILTETGYKEFLAKCYKFGDLAISEFRMYRDKYSES
jgi:hypothetical protein